MSDILCAKCEEPWDSWGVSHGDMEPHEAARFHRGDGCPACGFATRCVQCSGSGFDQETGSRHCFWCQGRVLVYARRLLTGQTVNPWMVGFLPDWRPIPPEWIAVATKGRNVGLSGSKQGPVVTHAFVCPDCAPQAEPCRWCNGDGRLRVAEGSDLRAAISACDASDEEPLGILAERGIF